MIVYDSSQLYIDSATSVEDRISKIDAIIDVLLATALESATTDNFTEYALDDGQTKIKAIYKGTDAIFNSINTLRRTKIYYQNELNGRVVRLVPGKSFRR
jgi:hypothetical protein